MENLKKYYLRTEGYNGDALIWWRPERRGYTINLDEAGKYDALEAKCICVTSHRTVEAYECEVIDNMEKGVMRIVHADYIRKIYPENFEPTNPKPGTKN